MHKLVPLRHGESAWNGETAFMGWPSEDIADINILQVGQKAKNKAAEALANQSHGN